jgi:hypothetical protein
MACKAILASALIVLTGALIGSSAIAADQSPAVKPGEMVFLQIKGDAASEMMRQMGQKDKVGPGAFCSVPAHVARVFSTGHIEIETSLPLPDDSKSPRMLTVRTIVDSNQLVQRVSPKGTEVYSSPGDTKANVKPVALLTEERSIDVTVSDLKQMKLQTWQLVDEVGGVKVQPAR